jgi:hypothetical protein
MMDEEASNPCKASAETVIHLILFSGYLNERQKDKTL